MNTCTVDRQWRVRVWVEAALPVSVAAAWSVVRDLPEFATVDPFHARIRLPDGGYGPGNRIVIEHRFVSLRLERIGRILEFTEGVGYSFSDLSRRGAGVGFPHIYRYRIEPREEGCVLSIAVRGRWTATFLPRWGVRLWLLWVSTLAVQMAGNAVMIAALGTKSSSAVHRT